MYSDSNVSALVELIRQRIPADNIQPFEGWGDHLGAVLVDASLQAGIKYTTVVEPRVRRILGEHPEAATLPGVQTLFPDVVTAQSVLQWRGPKKPQIVCSLIEYLVDQKIQTVAELREYLRERENADDLAYRVKGIGDKTKDYLCLLVGLPAVAIDSRLRAFVEPLGLTNPSYDDLQRLIVAAAEQLGVAEEALDYALWGYQEGSAAPRHGESVDEP
jgi:hypothetical protein